MACGSTSAGLYSSAQHTGEDCVVASVTLAFNLTYWQNRRARIYLVGDELAQLVEPRITEIPYYLVLEPDTHGKAIRANGSYVTVYNYERAKEFFELQVWRFNGNQRVHFSPNGGPTLHLYKLGVNRGKVYCTIDCDKGLKVQQLFLIGIFRCGNVIYISPETPFPSPSSRRRLMTERSRPYHELVAPYFVTPNIKHEVLIKEELIEEEDVPNHPAIALDSENFAPAPDFVYRPLTNGQALAPYNGTQPITSSPTKYQFVAPQALTTNDVVSVPPLTQLPVYTPRLLENDLSAESDVKVLWDALGSFIMSVCHDQGRAFRQLESKINASAKLEGKDIIASKKDFLRWLYTSDTDNGTPCLSHSLIQCIIPSLSAPWLFGTISTSTSMRLLSERYSKSGRPVFLIRMCLNKRPYFAMDAIYTDNGEQRAYKTLIKYCTDSSQRLFFWLDTKNDAKMSKSYSLSEMATYIAKTTMWLPMEPDLYDQVGLPGVSSSLSNTLAVT